MKVKAMTTKVEIISDELVAHRSCEWDGLRIGRVQITKCEGRTFKICWWYQNAKLLYLDCVEL